MKSQSTQTTQKKKECKHEWELFKMEKGYASEFIIAVCKKCLAKNASI